MPDANIKNEAFRRDIIVIDASAGGLGPLLHAQAVQAEEMRWSLLRTHQERAALARRMAEQERTESRDALAEQSLWRAHGYDEDAEVVRRLLRDHTSLVETEDNDQDTT